jgi:NaMN:DMB phosphoribosyltransferase
VILVARLHGEAPDPVDVAAEIGIPESAAVDALRFGAAYPAIIDGRIAVRERAMATAPGR